MVAWVQQEYLQGSLNVWIYVSKDIKKTFCELSKTYDMNKM